MTAKRRPSASSSRPRFADSVFYNCPFDRAYWPVFEAVVFCVIDCGFVPRCALEAQDSGEIRAQKIQRLIVGSMYAIHDISRVEVDPKSGLPRFNMPFELGLDLGCRRFGEGAARRKRSLILDSAPHRYQLVLSDIAGQDIRAHGGAPDRAIEAVRDWLVTTSRRKGIPGASRIRAHFARFSDALPVYCDRQGLARDRLQFFDYVVLIEEWLKAGEHAGA